MDEQQTPAPDAAGDDATRESATPEAVESTEGQETETSSQPAEDDDPKEEASEEPSPSKQRRERRKQEMERLRKDADEAKARVAEFEARQARIAKAAKANNPPNRDDFNDPDEYIAARAAFMVAQTMSDRQAAEIDSDMQSHRDAAAQFEQRQKAAMQEGWQDQVAEARQRYADFDQVALDDAVTISPDMAQVIQSSDAGADLAYYLGRNRGEAAQIAQMNPLDAARTLGAIEARLSLPKANTVTQAPDPVTPSKSRGSVQAKDPTKMSIAEFKKWREGGGTF